MIVQCPACGTRYNVPDQSIPADGRTVRCAHCTREWRVGGQPAIETGNEAESDNIPLYGHELGFDLEADPADLPEPVAAVSSTIATTPVVVPEKSGGRGKTIFTAMVLAALFLAGIGVVAKSAPFLGAHWPAARRIPVFANEKSSAEGDLLLKEVHAQLETSARGDVLTLQGEILNASKKKLAVPGLHAVLTAPGGTHEWNFNAHEKMLEAGNNAHFSASFDGKDCVGGNVLLTFSAEDASTGN